MEEEGGSRQESLGAKKVIMGNEGLAKPFENSSSTAEKGKGRGWKNRILPKKKSRQKMRLYKK